MVQTYKSTDVGAPILSGVVGSLTSLLDACLVNGYATIGMGGITSAGGLATATIPANSTLRTGDSVIIAGAAEAPYNGTVAVTMVNATTFTYPVGGAPASPATGTLTYRKAPLGWTTPYTSLNVRTYRSADTTSNQFILRVDDSATIGNVREAYVRGFEGMSDVNSGTGLFPTDVQLAGGMRWHKSSTADATARAWTVIGDGRTFYIFIHYMLNTVHHGYGFGHFISYKAADAYNTFIFGSNGPSSHSGLDGVISWSGLTLDHVLNATGPAVANASFVARAHTQTGSAAPTGVASGKCTVANPIGVSGAAGLTYPNGPDAGLYVTPLSLMDYTSSTPNLRGRLPGMYSHVHNIIPQAHYETATGIGGLPGVTLMAHQTINQNQSYGNIGGSMYIDITGPWT